MEYKDADDRNDNKKFDECKTRPFAYFTPPILTIAFFMVFSRGNYGETMEPNTENAGIRGFGGEDFGTIYPMIFGIFSGEKYPEHYGSSVWKSQ